MYQITKDTRFSAILDKMDCILTPCCVSRQAKLAAGAAGAGRHPYRTSRPQDAESLGASVAGPQDGIVGTADATIRLGTLPAWRMWEWRSSFVRDHRSIKGVALRRDHIRVRHALGVLRAKPSGLRALRRVSRFSGVRARQ